MSNEESGAGLALYQQLLNACAHGQLATAQECVDANAFFAMVPGQGRLQFAEYYQVFQRLRSVAPDFGDSVTVQTVIAQGDKLAMKYHMRYTLYGDRRIEFTGMDMVVFREGKIVEVHVFYDRADTREQAF